MGYYVTYEGSITIPADKRDAIFEALRDLNHRHDLKRGWRHPGTGDPYVDKWFAWMPPNYHETVESVEEVLRLLGFEVTDSSDSGVLDVYYDNKTGDEELFLDALVRHGGSVHLDGRGEEGEHWRLTVQDGELVEQAGRVVYD